MQDQSDEWIADRLNVAEINAVNDYTGAGYAEINKGLRDSKGKNITDQVRALDGALSKYKLGLNAKFYRGMGPIEVQAFENGVPIYEFKSLSASRSVADAFLQGQTGNKGGEVVIFNVPKGSKGAYIGMNSTIPGEKEFLLGRGQSYTVRRVNGVLEVTIHAKD